MDDMEILIKQIITEQFREENFSPSDIKALLEIVKAGMEVSESSAFSEAVELESMREGRSRSIKYIVKFKPIDLFEYIASTVITIAGSLTMPWVIILGFLVLVKQLYSASQVDIDEDSCKVLWIMYLINSENCKEYTGVLDFENISSSLNKELCKKGYSELSKVRIEESLKKLEEIYIIEKIGDEWEIIEFIQVNKEVE